ncbi:uncharacterized protein LOC105680576 [Bombus impatiens]|uniref:Uncharacterized protein LOC105680576 n=1 Tax=Bombus impatiens TaxID=132113 RepID=A0A6P8KYI0_BOMIM|nr:uncharacterized protein LOC105680576 [Bombus impatiens]
MERQGRQRSNIEYDSRRTVEPRHRIQDRTKRVSDSASRPQIARSLNSRTTQDLAERRLLERSTDTDRRRQIVDLAKKGFTVVSQTEQLNVDSWNEEPTDVSWNKELTDSSWKGDPHPSNLESAKKPEPSINDTGKSDPRLSNPRTAKKLELIVKLWNEELTDSSWKGDPHPSNLESAKKPEPSINDTGKSDPRLSNPRTAKKLELIVKLWNEELTDSSWKGDPHPSNLESAKKPEPSINDTGKSDPRLSNPRTAKKLELIVKLWNEELTDSSWKGDPHRSNLDSAKKPEPSIDDTEKGDPRLSNLRIVKQLELIVNLWNEKPTDVSWNKELTDSSWKGDPHRSNLDSAKKPEPSIDDTEKGDPRLSNLRTVKKLELIVNLWNKGLTDSSWKGDPHPFNLDSAKNPEPSIDDTGKDDPRLSNPKTAKELELIVKLWNEELTDSSWKGDPHPFNLDSAKNPESPINDTGKDDPRLSNPRTVKKLELIVNLWNKGLTDSSWKGDPHPFNLDSAKNPESPINDTGKDDPRLSNPRTVKKLELIVNLWNKGLTDSSWKGDPHPFNLDSAKNPESPINDTGKDDPRLSNPRTVKKLELIVNLWNKGLTDSSWKGDPHPFNLDSAKNPESPINDTGKDDPRLSNPRTVKKLELIVNLWNEELTDSSWKGDPHPSNLDSAQKPEPSIDDTGKDDPRLSNLKVAKKLELIGNLWNEEPTHDSLNKGLIDDD